MGRGPSRRACPPPCSPQESQANALAFNAAGTAYLAHWCPKVQRSRDSPAIYKLCVHVRGNTGKEWLPLGTQVRAAVRVFAHVRPHASVHKPAALCACACAACSDASRPAPLIRQPRPLSPCSQGLSVGTANDYVLRIAANGTPVILYRETSDAPYLEGGWLAVRRWKASPQPKASIG